MTVSAEYQIHHLQYLDNDGQLLRNDLPEPTDAQKEAGNYKKGHVRLNGLDISIENPQGSTRSGTG